MPRSVLRLALCALIFGFVSSGRAEPPISPTDEPIQLFNGRNLDGLYIWIKGHGLGDPDGVFSVRDGLLHVSGNGYGGVITEREYKDYHLICEYRWGEKTWPPREDRARDSGILVHCTGPDGGYNGTWHASIEAQIIEGGVGDILVVAGKNADGTPVPLSADAEVILDRDGERVWMPGGQSQTFARGRINWIGRDADWADVKGVRGPLDPDSPGQGWTRLEVICNGDRVTNIVNGVVVNHVFNVKPTAGKITLQTEMAELEVRRLELWPLGKAPRFNPAELTETAAAGTLKVGVGTAEITPPLGYPMSGYFHARGATGTLDPLLAKAVVFSQAGTKAALVVGDMIGIDHQLGKAVRERVQELTGIPPENVIVAATHSHTGPNYRADLVKYMSRKSDAPIAEGDRVAYIPQLIEGLASAVAAADKKTQPVSVQSGAGQEENVSFNRRFLLKDGTVRTWARLADKDVVRAAGPIDPEVGLVAFVPEGSDDPAAAIVNFALHCDTVGGTLYSADYPGHIERVLKKELGPQFTSIFATGPCGDINHADPTGKPRRSAAEIGERVATAAARALPDLVDVAPSLAVRQAVIDVPLQAYTDEEIAWAEETIAADRKGEKFPTVTLAKAYKLRRLQRLHAGQAELGRETDEVAPSLEGPRTSLPAEVQVIRLGDNTALVALPGEIFVELGLAIKEASPFEQTFVIELANSSPAYVPTLKAYDEGGYEATNSVYAPGGGEMLVEKAISLLKELKAE